MGAVPQLEFHRRRLNAVFARAKTLTKDQTLEELQADYARHLCVLISGFMERSLAEIIMAYASGKAPAPLRSFLDNSLKRITNVDKERLLNIVGSLDASWRLELDAFVTDERQAAINSIVGLRNDIAHGGGGSIGLLQVEKYWLSAQEVVDKVETLILRPQQARRR